MTFTEGYMISLEWRAKTSVDDTAPKMLPVIIRQCLRVFCVNVFS